MWAAQLAAASEAAEPQESLAPAPEDDYAVDESGAENDEDSDDESEHARFAAAFKRATLRVRLTGTCANAFQLAGSVPVSGPTGRSCYRQGNALIVRDVAAPD